MSAEPPAADAEHAGPLVDVFIPTRGGRPTVRESIECVLAQTYPAWRLVVTESGPGDPDVATAVEPFLVDPRVRHVTTPEQIGVGENHNRGAALGDAPYFGALHDDDRWGPTFLERRVALLEAHPECGYVFSPHVKIDGEGRELARTAPVIGEGCFPPEQIMPILGRSNVIGVPTVLLRRSAFEAAGGRYNPDLLFFDYELWLRLAARFAVGHVVAWDAEYRVHSGRETDNRRLEMGEHLLAVLDEAERQLPAELARPERRRARTDALLFAALDAAERGEPRRSLAYLRDLVSREPAAVLNPRVAVRAGAALGSLTLGKRGRASLSRSRTRRWREGSEPPGG